MLSPQVMPKRILVLCTGNSARSIMAEALFLVFGHGQIDVCSAGSSPTGKVHPMALQQISELPVDPARFKSKSITSVIGESPEPFDCVITVCDQAAQSCGLIPGNPHHLHWGLPDPAACHDPEQAQEAFSTCFSELRRRIMEYLQY